MIEIYDNIYKTNTKGTKEEIQELKKGHNRYTCRY